MILRVSVFHSWVATTGTGKKTFRIRILVLIAEVQAQHKSTPSPNKTTWRYK